jgi:hypothetical protein
LAVCQDFFLNFRHLDLWNSVYKITVDYSLFFAMKISCQIQKNKKYFVCLVQKTEPIIK